MLFQSLKDLFNFSSQKKNILVPLSQYRAIEEKEWQERGCGIVSLLMLLKFYIPSLTLTASELLHIARAEGVYQEGVGWKHASLAALSSDFGLYGANFDWKELPSTEALSFLTKELMNGPVIASVYRNAVEKTGGHLLVVSAIANDMISLYEVAETETDKIPQIVSLDAFLDVWKQRIIVVRNTPIFEKEESYAIGKA